MKKIYTLIVLMMVMGLVFGQTYHIGDLYTAPDGSQGVVFYENPDGSGGLVVALNNASNGCIWGASSDVTNLDNLYPTYFQQLLDDTAGYSNTQKIRAANVGTSLYAAGVVDFGNGWFLPSPAQLTLLYAMRPFISDALLAAGGTLMSEAYYWSSAEYSSANAWVVDFGDYAISYSGAFYNRAKSSSYPVRAIRSFVNTALVVDTTLTYSWSTGDSASDITVLPSQTTTYSVTVSTSGGCSDTAQYTIVVNTPVTEEITQTACDSYEWNGQTYTESGEYTQTFTAANGCDSIVTLHLTIKSSSHNTVTVDTCDSYTWHGTTYTSSGTYMYDYISASGCPSTDTLHLTITSAPDVNIIVTADTICAGDSVLLQVNVSSSSSMPSLHVLPIAVGDILCTDGSTVKPSAWPVAGKTAMGIVFYVDNTGEHGWAMHLNNENSDNTMRWGGSGIDITTLNNFSLGKNALSDLDGYGNTQKIRAAGNAATYPAAWTMDFDNGWYLPAAGQLRCIYPQLPTLNASLQIVGGLLFPMNSIWGYWSSTEADSSNAWHLDENGQITSFTKNMTYRVRSVRNF